MRSEERRQVGTRGRWPLVLALLFTAAAVALGIFGPRLVDKSHEGSTRPLGDLAGLVRDIDERMRAEALERPPEASGPTDPELSALVRESLEIEWSPPTLDDIACVVVLAGTIPLPEGRSGVAILFECAEEGSVRHVTLVATADDGRSAIFDEFGRARPFEAAEAILEPDDPTDPEGPSTFAWTDGAVVVMARCLERAPLESLRGVLGAR